MNQVVVPEMRLTALTDWIVRSTSILCLLCLSFVDSGCVTYQGKAVSVRSSLLSGQFAAAREIVEQEQNEDDVLGSLNKGMLRRMTGDYAASNEAFENARRQIDDLYGTDVNEQIGAMTVNDTLSPFHGDRFEQVLLHAYMAMNYIQLDDIDAARIEMLQADIKMREWGDQPEEDAFVRYLSGIIYEMLGENDQALVAYRKAYDIYRSSRDRLRLETPRIVKQDLLRLLAYEHLWNEYTRMKKEFAMSDYRPFDTGNDSGYGEVIVVLNNGLAPQREENAIQTFSDKINHMIRIALPAYKQKPVVLPHARVVMDGEQHMLETVENIDALARHALDTAMALITTRAIERAVEKHGSQSNVDENRGGQARILIAEPDLATERADTRSWTTLPQEIQLARFLVPKGQHQLFIEMLDASGRAVDRIDEVVDIQSGQRVLLSKHWVAPIHAIAADQYSPGL